MPGIVVRLVRALRDQVASIGSAVLVDGVMTTRYAFGDGDLAALRLAKVAEVFESTSRAFLSRWADSDIDLVLDLGCGPGHTTRLLVDVLRPRRTVGLDNATSFLGLAREPAQPGVSFVEHDVTLLPFPTRPADLIYCRFLLSHLADPATLPSKWATQLQPGGLLALDEVESIETRHPVFRSYLEIVAAMLDHRSACLYVGPLLQALPEPEGLRRCFSSLATLAPPVGEVSEMFLMNLGVWRHDPFVRDAYGDEVLDRLARDLAVIAETHARAEITWTLRQIAYRRL